MSFITSEIMSIVLFVALRDNFFVSPSCINCSIENFCAFEGADMFPGIDEVMQKKLVKFTSGVSISLPYIINNGFRRGNYIMASLSHKGVLAIFSEVGGYGVEFCNLVDGSRSEIDVETYTRVGFYDDKYILLTNWHPLRESSVDQVFFNKEQVSYTKLGDVDKVYCETDVTILNSTRELYYLSTDNIPYRYNVDTCVNELLSLDEDVWSFPSLTGIDSQVKVVFRQWEERWGLFYLDKNDIKRVISLRSGINKGFLTDLIPSESDPSNLDKALKVYDYLKLTTVQYPVNEDDIGQKMGFQGHNTIIRVFKNIFFLYDTTLLKWVLVRIIVY